MPAVCILISCFLLFSPILSSWTAISAKLLVQVPLTIALPVPRSFRRYTTPLLAAPLSHTTAFLILHEITAILPLFGLAGAFHYVGTPGVVRDWLAGSEKLREGEERFTRYATRKGWIAAEEREEVIELAEGQDVGLEQKNMGQRDGKAGVGSGVRVVVE
jgi:hypothetical protein